MAMTSFSIIGDYFMNKKLVFKNQLGDVRYVVLAETNDYTSQLEETFGISKGYGFSVDMTEKAIQIRDYFAGETRAEFEILSFEDCDLPVNLNQISVE
jgi:hypothetical protein